MLLKGMNIKLSLAIIIIFCTFGLSAQEKCFSMKVGVGFNVSAGSDYYRAAGDKVGPSMTSEITYLFNRWLSTGFNIHMNNTKIGDNARKSDYGVSLRGYVRPFARRFKWIEVGMGITGVYRSGAGVREWHAVDGTVMNVVYNDYDLFYFGFDFPLRCYLIDNSKYQLLLYYDLKTIFDKGGKYLWNYSNGGLMFGVKF